MASPTSSYAPSSSAVTIPTPGKSILKRTQPTQQSFFSRISKFLPTQAQPQVTAGDETRTLKRAHFILPELATVYPISAANPPSTPTLKEEKRSIEQREAERRRRVIRGNSTSQGGGDSDEWWSLEKVESFYRECCASRDDPPSAEISVSFKNASKISPRTVDFSGVQLNPTSAAILSDVHSCTFNLTDQVAQILKPILHALLIPGTLTFLSVASNRRLKAPAFRLIGAFMTKAKTLQFLDLSQNSLDKRSIEYIANALPQAAEPGLSSIKLDDCFLKPQALEALAHTVRTSSLRNISLRYNRINAAGAVAIALMIRDYPDVVSGGITPASSAPSTPPMSPAASSPTQLPNTTGPAPSTVPLRPASVLPPPRHPMQTLQPTYTPYIPRSRRGPPATAATMGDPLSATGQPIPLITSSAQGGVTARHPVPPSTTLGTYQDHGPSAALLDKVRALDALPRLGALRTLDLRGNDIRGGITYIAQVLKRNRTLKVLNLSENKLEVTGLVAIAEALKYNSCLETLDLSKNPCCGPGLDGVQSLRTAFTLNTALKRLFLSSTGLLSAGAIALAEFLPESVSLLHLDLTMNTLDLAGVMALSSGLKGNHVMRCLDLNIPPDDEALARMCRDILNTCIRNTEEAERSAQPPSATGTSGRGQGKGVWGMIEESKLAKTFRKDEEKKVESCSPRKPPESLLISEAAQNEDETVAQAQLYKEQLQELLTHSTPTLEGYGSKKQVDSELIKRTKAFLPSLAEIIRTSSESTRLDELLYLNDALISLLARASPKPRISLQGLGIELNGLRDPPTGAHGANNGFLDNQIVPSGNTEGVTDEDVLSTPRLDKGKGKAPPEPEIVEPVLSTAGFTAADSDEEETDHTVAQGEDDVRSPTDRSRSWVAEEGEIFRKGNKLLGPEEMEGEYAGEELRIELLEARVERPPPRAILDDLSLALDTSAASLNSPALEGSPKPLPSPYIPRRSSPSSIMSPTQLSVPENGATESPNSAPLLSPAPRPHISRKKESSSSFESR
ncbi:hypothetical protein B0F90DRAFT_1810386 [Multifurca ochricompacta]|uniref:RNI-like protein n=1 Tax=Multifurca ochricompacta TaxID=376703 RepID=A0AAD4M3W1_9AGAM|nr:hypothetical protein B0F90DRAFT_1810386 [Multifurca ochricompacta]